MNTATENAVNTRYSGLSASTCCLSCGGAINFSEALEGAICVDLGSGRGNDVIFMAESMGPLGFVFGIEAISARRIIIATVSIPKTLSAVGEKDYIGQGISYCATCDAKYYEGRDVIVVGDVTSRPYRQITTAVADGTIAAMSISAELD